MREKGFKVRPRGQTDKTDSVNTAGCLHPPLCAPHPSAPIVCVPSEGALSCTHTLIRTVGTANSTSLTARLMNYNFPIIYCASLIRLEIIWRRVVAGELCILKYAEKFAFVSLSHSEILLHRIEASGDKY